MARKLFAEFFGTFWLCLAVLGTAMMAAGIPDVGVGWIGAIAFPAIVAQAGLGAGILIAFGGLLYTIGAVIYAMKRPDPNPRVFGYHEIFHVLVVAAAAAHFAAIALYASPAG